MTNKSIKEDIAARLEHAIARAKATAQDMRTLQHDLLCTGHCGHLYLADGVQFSAAIAAARKAAEDEKQSLIDAEHFWNWGKEKKHR